MDVQALFNSFEGKNVLVVGDVMIDAYLRGDVSRISPESPVPIVNLTKSEDRLGGAANVALNLSALGAIPILCAVIGKDRGGQSFSNLLEKRNLSNKGIVYSENRITTTKTRVIGNNQHLLRIDEEEITFLTEAEEKSLLSTIQKLIQSGVDGIILEDYNKGVLTENVIQTVIQMANDANIPTAVDPKKDNFFAYQGATLFKPNLKELKEGVHLDFSIATQKKEFEKAVKIMEDKLNNEISFITLSEHGVFIKKEDEKHYISAHIRNISDVSGAGDTVISVATLCLIAGCSIEQIASISNLAGGLVCEISGVVPIDKNQLKKEVRKIYNAN